LYNSIHK